MPHTFRSYATTIAVVVGALVGSAALSALAANVWTAPTEAPPNGNVDAPINTGSLWQSKTGPLKIGSGTQTPNTALEVIGTGIFSSLGLTGNLFVAGTTTIQGGSPAAGKILTAVDSSGNAVWQNVQPSSSVTCTPVNNTSFINLNGNSGNNNWIIVNLGTLPAGTYTFSGSISSGNAGGGGQNSVFVSSSVYTNSSIFNSPTGTLAKMLSTYSGDSYGNDSTYRMYYTADDPDIVYALKRGGYNDIDYTIPSESITITGTKYLYLLLGQAAVSGSLTVTGTTDVCTGGSSSSGSSRIISGYPNGILCTSGNKSMPLYINGVSTSGSDNFVRYSSTADVGGQHNILEYNASTKAYVSESGASTQWSDATAACHTNLANIPSF